MLVFLDKQKKTNSYQVHALSYGVKHSLTESDYGINRSRIKEMQEMLQSQETKKCNECLTNWLIKCAEEKCTRWEGVYELSPRSDFMAYYDDAGKNMSRSVFFTVSQRRRLFDVLVLVDTLAYADMPLTDIAKDVNDSFLLEF